MGYLLEDPLIMIFGFLVGKCGSVFAGIDPENGPPVIWMMDFNQNSLAGLLPNAAFERHSCYAPTSYHVEN
jgi:hypothetical protein